MDRVSAHIFSASRRTDIPAFFTPWLMERIRAGFVMVRNPRNAAHVMRVSLASDDVVAMVFWSRDYGRLLPHLSEIDDRGLRPIFQFTFTGYGAPLERDSPPLGRVLGQFEQLAARYGRERVVWRYDPIVCSDARSANWHVGRFEGYAAQLDRVSGGCVLSFLDLYPSTRRALAAIADRTAEQFVAPTLEQRIALSRELTLRGEAAHLKVSLCCEPDVAAHGLRPARCIDPDLVRAVAADPMLEFKDAPTRKGCGCVHARDIGAYHSCAHGCEYCYATETPEIGQANAKAVSVSANHLGQGDIEEAIPPRRTKGQQLALPGVAGKRGKTRGP